MDENSRFRCNFLKQTNGYGAVFRLIPTQIASLEELGIPPVVKEFGDLRGGLVLVTGPTGSGKSTTLAALIDYINTNYARHIVTIEEPIEFVHSQQAQHHHAARGAGALGDFSGRAEGGSARGLRHRARRAKCATWRRSPLALTAAETGLLVFGTLHTNNARKTVDRMIDVFPADKQPQVRTMLANSLRGVRRATSPEAGRRQRPPRRERNPHCRTIAVSSIIREGATQKLQDVIVGGKGQGMQFMDDAIWALLQQGAVSPHEAYMKAIDKNLFKKFLPADEQGFGQLRRRHARRRTATAGRFREGKTAERLGVLPRERESARPSLDAPIKLSFVFATTAGYGRGRPLRLSRRFC